MKPSTNLTKSQNHNLLFFVLPIHLYSERNFNESSAHLPYNNLAGIHMHYSITCPYKEERKIQMRKSYI